MPKYDRDEKVKEFDENQERLKFKAIEDERVAQRLIKDREAKK